MTSHQNRVCIWETAPPHQNGLLKSNFQEEDETDTEQTAKLISARQLATTIMEYKSCLCSKCFPGDDKNVSDSLSRDIDLSDKT